MTEQQEQRTLRLRITRTGMVDWRKLEWLQGDLKEMTKANFEKFLTVLRGRGFASAFHVWEEKPGKDWILDGHGRKRALLYLEEKEGYKIPDQLPAVWVECKDVTEAREMVLMFASAYGKANNESLYEYLHLNDLPFETLKTEIELPDMSLPTFERGYMTDHETADRDPGALPKEPRTKRGDLYVLAGGHRVLCGDCAQKADWETLTQGQLADMVFIDPPYGVDHSEKNKLLNSYANSGIRNTGQVLNDALTNDEQAKFLLQVFQFMKAYGGETCAYYITAPQGGELNLLMLSILLEAGLPVRHVLNWVKNGATFSMGRLDYEYRHEPIYYTWKKRHHFHGLGKFKDSVWAIDKPRRADLHPNMKPVELVVNALLNSTREKELLVDVFVGSGTSILAAHQTKRVCYAMELEPRYCDVAIQRFVDLTGEAAMTKNGHAYDWRENQNAGIS